MIKENPKEESSGYSEREEGYLSVEKRIKDIEDEYEKPSEREEEYLRELAKIQDDEEQRKKAFLALVPDTLKEILENWPDSDTEQDEDSGEEFEDTIRFRQKRLRSILRKTGKPENEFDKLYILNEIANTPKIFDFKEILNSPKVYAASELEENFGTPEVYKAFERWHDAKVYKEEFSKRGNEKFKTKLSNKNNENKQMKESIYQGEGEKFDLKFTNLTDVAVWQLEHESEIGNLTDEEFARRYTYKRGHPINPKSLRMARNGTGQYKKSAFEVLEERKRQKENSERKK